MSFAVKSSSSSSSVSISKGSGHFTKQESNEGIKDYEIKSRQSGIHQRNFIFTRSAKSLGSSRASMSSMSGGRMSLSAGTMQQLTQSGITGFKDERTKEKQELQSLNERLASYIEKVHYLGAEVQRLEAENEALRNRKTEDLQPIKDAYENELAQARLVITEFSAKEGEATAKLVGLNDEITRLQDLIVTYESHAVDYRKKMTSLDDQIGNLEGELSTLRASIALRDDESEKQRELILKYQDQIRKLRADLELETTGHIEAECLALTKTEEASFYKDLYDQLELMKPEPIRIKGMDASEFWQSSMKRALREIQAACDEKITLLQHDIEAKFSYQVSTMKAGSVKDNIQLENSKEEILKLKTQLSDQRAYYSELTTKVAILQSERDQFAMTVGELETKMDEMRVKYDLQITSLQEERESILLELNKLRDAKCSIEGEIITYEKLLECEENRAGWKNWIGGGQVSMSGGQMGLTSEQMNSSSASFSHSTRKMQVQRKSKGSIGIQSIDHEGGNVVIENDSKHAQARSMTVSGWKLQKKVNGNVVKEVRLKEITLNPGQSFTVWAKGAKKGLAGAMEQVEEAEFNFGVGNCDWSLVDNLGDEKATLAASFM